MSGDRHIEMNDYEMGELSGVMIAIQNQIPKAAVEIIDRAVGRLTFLQEYVTSYNEFLIRLEKLADNPPLSADACAGEIESMVSAFRRDAGEWL